MLEKVCPHCGATFCDPNRLLRQSGAPTKFCSALCRRRAATKRRHARRIAAWRQSVQDLSPEARQTAERIITATELCRDLQPASSLFEGCQPTSEWGLESLDEGENT